MQMSVLAKITERKLIKFEVGYYSKNPHNFNRKVILEGFSRFLPKSSFAYCRNLVF